MAPRQGGVGGLVLAAGMSRRYGGAKLLATVGGRSVVGRVLATAGAACEAGLLQRTFAVVAEGDEAVAELARESGAAVVVNPDPASGLSRSLQAGLAALPSGIAAAMVLLGDQPLVRIDVIDALIDAWRNGRATVLRPRYSDARDAPGHPVLLDRETWRLAATLEGDGGMGKLFADGDALVAVIDVIGANPDVDTPADLLLLEDSIE